jgi:hypothetical protein
VLAGHKLNYRVADNILSYTVWRGTGCVRGVDAGWSHTVFSTIVKPVLTLLDHMKLAVLNLGLF